MGRILVLFKDNKIHIVPKSRGIDTFIRKGYEHIITIGLPYSPRKAMMIYKYFQEHPEKVTHYFLK